MSKVWKCAPYEGGTLLVLLALADWADDDGHCWPSVPVLAKKARLKDRQTRYALRKLEEDGFISTDEQRGRNHTNRYQINLHKLQVIETENLHSATPKPAFYDTENLHPSAAKPLVDTPEDTLEGQQPKKQAVGAKRTAPKVTTLPRDPLLLNFAVVVYRDLCHLTPNHEQRKKIAGTVTDNNLWYSVCEAFMAEGRPPQRVDWLLERYAKARGQPATETKEEKQERLRRQYEERARNGRDAARPAS